MGQDKCNRCSKNSRLKEAEYCSRCLVEVIEKRVSKKLNALDDGGGRLSGGRISIVCDSKTSLSCAAAAYIAKKLCKTAALLVINPASQHIMMRQPHSAVIMPECADEAATSLLEMLTSNAISSRKGITRGVTDAVNIFESVTEKELELYATIKKIKYAKGKSSKYSDLKQKIQKLQARYPGTIEALAQASRHIEQIRLKQA